jgi:hypothetical protein
MGSTSRIMCGRTYACDTDVTGFGTGRLPLANACLPCNAENLLQSPAEQLNVRPGHEQSEMLWGVLSGSCAGLYIVNFECRDSRLICKIFSGQCPPLSPFL